MLELETASTTRLIVQAKLD